MCGISGFLNLNNNFSHNDLKKFSLSMSSTLERRGPDSFGIWVEKEKKLTLSHRRLSIIDLNERSDQPMHSINGRFVIVYNGEIYNYLEIKEKLIKKNVKFKTDSDTEVILESISEFGLEDGIKQLEGMFSIAVWDKKLNNLFLIRDRIGIKPLFFYFDSKNFAFASEIKAFKKLPWLDFSIDKQALSSYVRFNYVPAPYSIFSKIKKIEPGTILKINLNQKISIKKYWDLTSIAKRQSFNKRLLNEFDLELLLEKKIKNHMISDVPLGVFLSGGIDSSLVAILSQKNSKKKISSFTIGFNEQSYNEANDAKKISKIIDTNHYEKYFSYDEFERLIENIVFSYDEPFADSSQLPTMLLSEITKKKVTVALSGDGGDELFGGYYRYFMAENYKKFIFDQPLIFKNFLSKLIYNLPVNFWNNLGVFIPNKFGGRQFGDKLYKLAKLLKESDENCFYERIISNYNDLSDLLVNPAEKNKKLFDKHINSLFPDLIERMQIVDTLTYLPDDILTKVDRASMFNSLEIRVPFLDHNIVEFAWNLPINQKIKKGNGKIILKKILEKYLPKNLIYKPKMGFGIPLGKFIVDKLKDEIEFFLNSKEVKNQNLFKLDNYKRKWNEHLEGKRNWQFLIWNFYIFQKWYQKWN